MSSYDSAAIVGLPGHCIALYNDSLSNHNRFYTIGFRKDAPDSQTPLISLGKSNERINGFR